jgi:ABC-type antimicrobial peptide transport system permease subunit
MFSAVGLASLLYLISQSLLSTLARRRELALMNAVGWRYREISLLVLGEASVLGLLSGLCSVALAVSISISYGLSVSVAQIVALGFLLGPALWIARQPIADPLQRGEIAGSSIGTMAGSHKARARRHRAGEHARLFGTGLSGIVWFAWHNLLRRRLRAFLAAGSIAVAATLLMALLAALLALGGTLRITLLGQFVGLQVQFYHFIMVASALAASVLAVVDHIAMGVLERRHELALLHALGWRIRDVQLSILLEGALLALAGGLTGSVVSMMVAIASRNDSILVAWWTVPFALLMVLTLCSLGAIYAASLAPTHGATRVLQ